MSVLTEAVPKESSEETIARIAAERNLPVATVRGVLGDCARGIMTHESLAKIAGRWGLAVGETTSLRNFGRFVIEDYRDGFAMKNAAIANRAQDLLIDELNRDGVNIAPEKLSMIAKQSQDSMLNVMNGATGPVTNTTNIGEVKILMQMRERREKWVPVEEKIAKLQ